MAAMLVLGKFVLHMVPNVEVVTPFIIIFTFLASTQPIRTCSHQD